MPFLGSGRKLRSIIEVKSNLDFRVCRILEKK